jgi:dUTP pyrophosphatase
MRKDVVPPTRANPSDAGLDVHCCPKESVEKGYYLEPGDSVIVPTGLKFGIPHGYMLEVKNRSGMAAKRSLVVGACVIDSGYEGEVFINLHNIGKEPQWVMRNDKIAQLVLVRIEPVRFIESPDDNLYGWYPITISDRKDGSLGSTDNRPPLADATPTGASRRSIWGV